MRREELLTALENIRGTIKRIGLRQRLTNYSRGPQETSGSTLIVALQDWFLYVRTTTPHEREVIQVLGLEVLADVQFWNTSPLMKN
jgi:hypothetical protein